MTPVAMFALVTGKSIREAMTWCYASAIVQVPEWLLKGWHFVLASDNYKWFYLFHAWLGFSYVPEFVLVQKQPFFQKRLSWLLNRTSRVFFKHRHRTCFIISKWDAPSSFCVGFLTCLHNVSKNFVPVPALVCVTAEWSFRNEVRSSSNISLSALTALVEGLTLSVKGKWMCLTKLKNYTPLIL